MVRSKPHALMSHGEPFGPRPLPLKRYTTAAEVMDPIHARKAIDCAHGPMESARHGTGL